MRYDITILGADIYDGTGSPPQQNDVGIKDGRIHKIGDLSGAESRQEVNASGLALAPGFIDVHTHDDFAALLYPDMGFKLKGGVTTCIVGNCGFGAAPFAEACIMGKALHSDLSLDAYEGYRGYVSRLEQIQPGANIAILSGHGTLRLAAMGTADRAPDGAEMRHMKSSLAEALEAGAVGLSTGLVYEPGRYAKTEEIIELAQSMRDVQGIYATHMRDEGEGLLESVEEAIHIGQSAGVNVQISHHKASGRKSWGLVAKSLRLIEQAQARGESVHADQYPYTAGSTILKAVLENGAFLSHVQNSFARLRPQDVVIASCAAAPQWEGQSFAHLSEALTMAPRQAAEHVLGVEPGTTVVLHMMSEEDVRTVLQHPSTMIGSDGIPTLNGKPHPRLYNSFARVLGHYARDQGLFSLATAVYRMTGFPAKKFKLTDRGEIREGAHADLVVFDPVGVIDRGTFEHPNLFPNGIDTVIVNGNIAVTPQGELPGRFGRPLPRST